MDMEQACRTYKISRAAMEKFCKKGWIGPIIDEESVRRASLILFLIKVRASDGQIGEFISSYKEGGGAERRKRILRELRDRLHGDIRAMQKELDCIDYLLFRETQNKEENS